MQNKTILVAAVAVIIAAVAIAAGFVLMDSGSEYEKVQDTGEMIGLPHWYTTRRSCSTVRRRQASSP